MSASGLLFFFFLSFFFSANGEYMIGVGRYDITGPAVQVEMVRKGLEFEIKLHSVIFLFL